MTVSVPDLEKHLDEYLRAVEKGETIVICRGAVSIARITGIPLRRNCTKLGFDRGRIEILGDLTGPVLDSDGPNRRSS